MNATKQWRDLASVVERTIDNLYSPYNGRKTE